MASSQRADPFATLQQLPAAVACAGADAAEVVALLRKIEKHLAALAATGGQGPARPIAEADGEAMSIMLPILGEGLGPTGRAFTAAEALEHLQKQPGVQVDLGSKALGKLFARCAGAAIAGFRIRRDGSLRGAAVWRIWRV